MLSSLSRGQASQGPAVHLVCVRARVCMCVCVLGRIRDAARAKEPAVWLREANLKVALLCEPRVLCLQQPGARVLKPRSAPYSTPLPTLGKEGQVARRSPMDCSARAGLQGALEPFHFPHPGCLGTTFKTMVAFRLRACALRGRCVREVGISWWPSPDSALLPSSVSGLSPWPSLLYHATLFLRHPTSTPNPLQEAGRALPGGQTLPTA